MKIGFLRHPSSSIERNCITTLAKRGYEVHVIYFEGNINATKDATSDFPDLVKLENVYLHCIGTGALMSNAWMSNQNPTVRRFTQVLGKTITEQIMTLPKTIALRMLLQNIKPDILHAHTVDYFGYWGAKSHYRPFIVTAWGSDVLVTPKKSPGAKCRVQYTLNKANVITTINGYIRAYIIREFNVPAHKVLSFEWGIPLDIFHKGHEAEAAKLKHELKLGASFVLLSPRYIRDHYRIDNIVEAMPLILQKHPDTALLLLRGLAHGNDYETRIERLAEELGISNHLRIIKRELTPHEMAVMYNISDACISIPLTDGFGFSNQEAMACGTIPIVANLEVYHQYLTDNFNALYVDGGNADDIAQKVIYSIEHPEIKGKFYEINRRIIEKYCNWEKNMDNMEDLYGKLARSKK